MLGLNFGASKEQISKAFRQQSRKWHPDKTLGSHSDAMFKRLNDAKEVLLSEKGRADYDEKLADEGKTNVNPVGFLPAGQYNIIISQNTLFVVT